MYDIVLLGSILNLSVPIPLPAAPVTKVSVTFHNVDGVKACPQPDVDVCAKPVGVAPKFVVILKSVPSTAPLDVSPPPILTPKVEVHWPTGTASIVAVIVVAKGSLFTKLTTLGFGTMLGLPDSNRYPAVCIVIEVVTSDVELAAPVMVVPSGTDDSIR